MSGLVVCLPSVSALKNSCSLSDPDWFRFLLERDPDRVETGSPPVCKDDPNKFLSRRAAPMLSSKVEGPETDGLKYSESSDNFQVALRCGPMPFRLKMFVPKIFVHDIGAILHIMIRGHSKITLSEQSIIFVLVKPLLKKPDPSLHHCATAVHE